MSTKARKYILSLDGGGFRGLSSLIILNHIMRMLVDDPDEEPIPSPFQIFDLICGTSTGGIIAILLGRFGLDCSTAITVYNDFGERVYGEGGGKLLSRALREEKLSSAAFEDFLGEAVERYTGSKNTAMKDWKSNPDAMERGTTDVFVTAVSTPAGSATTPPHRIRSYPTPRGGVESTPNHRWTIRQAARATSATPMYFSPVQIGSQAFQDAATSGFNNPTLEALEEAGLRWNPQDHDFVIVSLGTGLESLLRDNFSDKKTETTSQQGLGNVATATIDSYERISKQIMKVARDTEGTHREVTRRFSSWNRRDDYLRFNPPQGLGDLDLADHMNEGTIIEIANIWLRTPHGRESTLSAYEKLKPAYEKRLGKD